MVVRIPQIDSNRKQVRRAIRLQYRLMTYLSLDELSPKVGDGLIF